MYMHMLSLSRCSICAPQQPHTYTRHLRVDPKLDLKVYMKQP